MDKKLKLDFKNFGRTITHEIGHNLGMKHICTLVHNFLIITT